MTVATLTGGSFADDGLGGALLEGGGGVPFGAGTAEESPGG